MMRIDEDYIWVGVAEYEDGSRIEKGFPFYEDRPENEQIHDIESWLICHKDGCKYYSVTCEYRY